MKWLLSLAGGLAGAATLTIMHELLRKNDPEAPRMDLLGMESLSKLIRKAGGELPGKDKLFNITMAGDVAGNALYYSLAGAGDEKNLWQRAIALGLAAGAGAVLLPEPLGLNEKTSNRTTETKLLTVALYTTGALVTGAAISWLKNKKPFSSSMHIVD